jgi:hypothetical protein
MSEQPAHTGPAHTGPAHTEPARTEKDLREHLLELEGKLMDPDFRRDRKQVAALLAEDFVEFGSSGNEWSRERILDLLETERDWTEPQVEDFKVRVLGPDAALATYRTVRPDMGSLRSSVWIREAGAWRILFHQGTRYAIV